MLFSSLYAGRTTDTFLSFHMVPLTFARWVWLGGWLLATLGDDEHLPRERLDREPQVQADQQAELGQPGLHRKGQEPPLDLHDLEPPRREEVGHGHVGV